MVRIRARIALHLIALLVLAVAVSAAPREHLKQLAPGVSLYQAVTADAASNLVVNGVYVDLRSPGVSVKAAVGSDCILDDTPNKGRENISALTARKGALIGVNADFFPFTGDPLGVCVVDGELLSEPSMNRASAVFLSNGAALIDSPRLDAKLYLPSGVSRQIDGINRNRETNQVIAYSPAYGARTETKYKGVDIVATSDDLPVRVGKLMKLTVTEVLPDALNTAIPKSGMVISAGGPAAWFLRQNVKPGDTISVRFDIKSTAGCDWSGVRQAVSGGPWLVKNGKQFIDYKEEGFGSSFSTTHHPRTALGLTADGKMLLVTVDGRQSISGGISLADLSKLMIQLGAVNAMNLDGGGSTTLCVRGLFLNSPSGGMERPVANGLLVFADRPRVDALPKLAITGIDGDAVSGQGTQLFLTWGDDAQMLTEDQLANVVWGNTGGVGLVDQSGYFMPVKARKGSVSALYGDQLVKLNVNVLPGAPKSASVSVTADKDMPNRATVKVTVFDADSNAVPGQPVVLTASGGTLDASSGTTDASGAFTTSLLLGASAKEAVVTATCGSITDDARLAVK